MTMNCYKKEFESLKPSDQVQSIRPCGKVFGTYFLETAGHGYLAVPKKHPLYKTAEKIIEYGFKGSLACYLEEDCEMAEFLKRVL